MLRYNLTLYTTCKRCLSLGAWQMSTFYPQQNPSQRSEGAYRAEFMKLLRTQREPPFVYSTCKTRITRVNLAPLGVKLKPSEVTFEDLKVKEVLRNRLEDNDILKPLNVQAESLPFLLKGANTIIESTTGSGKTLAYLIPILQDMDGGACRNIIVVPTRELATQIYREIHTYAEDIRAVVRVVSGVNLEHDRDLKTALKVCNLIVATPKRLTDIVELYPKYFRNVKRIVLDEVDKLLPFNKRLGKHQRSRLSKPRPAEKLLGLLRHYSRRSQLVATSATISRFLVEELQDLGFGQSPALVKLVPESHRYGKVPDSIDHVYTVIPGDDDVFTRLSAACRLFTHFKLTSVLVFVDKGVSVEECVSHLRNLNFTAAALYKELLLPSPQAFDQFTESFRNGDVQFVVANHETVRGLDFPFVENVFITYVPESPDNYLHVAGRVGRLGNPGRAISILSDAQKKSEKKHLKRRWYVLGLKGKQLELDL